MGNIELDSHILIYYDVYGMSSPSLFPMNIAYIVANLIRLIMGVCPSIPMTCAGQL